MTWYRCSSLYRVWLLLIQMSPSTPLGLSLTQTALFRSLTRPHWLGSRHLDHPVHYLKIGVPLSNTRRLPVAV